MSDTSNEPLITIILKSDIGPIEPNNFRPLSLIDVDKNILTKVLAMRMVSVLPWHTYRPAFLG